MDAFYASVEQRDRPELRGLPVIVGGTGRRGVVAAASYEARRFGVHSAMPTSKARQLCPEGVFLRSRMAHYQQASVQIFEIFRRFTPLVESLSLDEAFLDVTASRRLHGDAETIAREIKRAVLMETGLVASVGVASNKFLAKLASDQDKPDGLFVVRDGDRQQFLDPLPVTRIWGIGRKAGARLEHIGVRTVAQLRRSDPNRLQRILGRKVEHFLALARGEDERDVVPARPDKSISHEVTLDEDLTSVGGCRRTLLELSGKVGQRLRRKQLLARTITVKIRDASFRTATRSHTMPEGTSEDRIIYQQACTLFEAWWADSGPTRIRLLGVGASGLKDDAGDRLFGQDGLDQVKDALRRRFGQNALRPATLIRPDEDD